MVAPASWFGHGSFYLNHFYCFRGVYPLKAQSLLIGARKRLCTTVTIFSSTQSRRTHSAIYLLRALFATKATSRLQEHWPRNNLPSLIFICYVINIRLRKTDRRCRHSGIRTYTDACIHTHIMYICYIHKIHTCICIHTYVYIRTYIHTHTHTHIHIPRIHIYIYIHIYIHTYTHTYTYTSYTYIYIHTYIHIHIPRIPIYIYIYIYTYIHTHIYTYTSYTYIYTYIYIYIHTHTHTHRQIIIYKSDILAVL